MTIDSTVLINLLQVGGQYLVPLATLMRALYLGARGRLPEGFLNILGGAASAGIAVGLGETGQIDFGALLREAFGSAAFTAGLLAFVVIYLLNTRLGPIIDVIVGGLVGAVIWLGSVYLLGHSWPIWYLLGIVPLCAIGFIILRRLIPRLMTLVRLASWLLVIGFGVALGAGGFLVYQSLTRR